MQEIITKLKFKGLGRVINAPSDLKIDFCTLKFYDCFDENAKSTNTLIFINNSEEFLDFLATQLNKIEMDSVLWFAYPKKTSKITTNINRDSMKRIAEKFNICAVSAIAINTTWSALRFRPFDRVGKN